MSQAAVSTTKKYVGKYRGTVLINIDPEQRGRLILEIADVLGPIPSTWAEACVPLAGPTGPPMGAYMVPPVGAGVWVEFEKGDPSRPVWVGCRWGAQSDIPLLAKAGNPLSPSIVLQTAGQHAFVISDMPPTPLTGGLMMKSATNAMIVVNDMGIFISNGKGATISMIGPTIDFNQGALTILK